MVRARKLPSGKKVYQADITINGKRYRREFDRLADARQWEQNQAEAVRTGNANSKTAGRQLVSEYFADHLATPSWAPGTRKFNECMIFSLIAPQFGNVRLNELSSQQVQSWVNQLNADGYAPETIHHAAGILARILDIAVERKDLAANPARHLKLPRKTRTVNHCMTQSQIWELAAAAEATKPGAGRFTLIIFLGYTGCRIGEAIALRPEAIDFDKKRVLISTAIAEVDGKPILGETKTHSVRQVPLPDFLIPYLKAQIEIAKTSPTGLLFPAARGGIIRRSPMRRWFNQAIKNSIGEHYTIHSLRHSFATNLIEAGENILVVSRILGHSSPDITLKVYSHWREDALDSAANRLNQAAQAHLGHTWPTEPEKTPHDQQEYEK